MVGSQGPCDEPFAGGYYQLLLSAFFCRKQGHFEARRSRREHPAVGKKDKQVLAQDEGKKHSTKNQWKVVGNCDCEKITPDTEKVVGESSKSGQEINLESIRVRREGTIEEATGVWFVSPDGELFDACLEESRADPSKVVHSEAVAVRTSGVSLIEEELEGHTTSKRTLSKQQENWFKLIEADHEGDD